MSDAGPLIHLSEIGFLALHRVFETLHIPDRVWTETVEQKRVPESDISELNVIHRHTLTPAQVAKFISEHGLEKLQAGEVECLCLCREIGVPVLLTDDLAVREVARRLHLTAVGSLGIVVRSYRVGLIQLTDAEDSIVALYDRSSLFVTRAIIELAIEQLHNHSGPG